MHTSEEISKNPFHSSVTRATARALESYLRRKFPRLHPDVARCAAVMCGTRWQDTLDCRGRRVARAQAIADAREVAEAWRYFVNSAKGPDVTAFVRVHPRAGRRHVGRVLRTIDRHNPHLRHALGRHRAASIGYQHVCHFPTFPASALAALRSWPVTVRGVAYAGGMGLPDMPASMAKPRAVADLAMVWRDTREDFLGRGGFAERHLPPFTGDTSAETRLRDITALAAKMIAASKVVL